jgi:phosphoribosylanthranilate isomerase
VTLIKICGITTLDDALQACDCGADALGFNFWPGSPRYLDPLKAAEIIERLPGNVLTVGVFVDEAAAQVDAVRQGAGIEVAQVHGPAAGLARRWWQAWPATAERIRERMEHSGAEAFLIDTPSGEIRGGTGRTFDWSLAAGLPGRVILAGGLDAGNVAEAMAAARPWGVDACSRLEREPGRKDHAKVAAFVRAARQAEL